jgi:uncharacterized protein (DUF924 family)
MISKHILSIWVAPQCQFDMAYSCKYMFNSFQAPSSTMRWRVVMMAKHIGTLIVLDCLPHASWRRRRKYDTAQC